MIKEYRAELERLVSEYLIDYITTFNTAFEQMESALEIGDINLFIKSNNTIINKLGKESRFNSFNEIDEFMNSDNILKI